MKTNRSKIVKFVAVALLIMMLWTVLIWAFFRFELYYLFYAEPLPESGVWHCEELRADIDFDKMHSDHPGQYVTVTGDDGSSRGYVLGLMSKGNTVDVIYADDDYVYGTDILLYGTYKFSGDVLTITSYEGKVYEFRQTGSNGASSSVGEEQAN